MAEPYLGYFLMSEGWPMTAPALAIACLLLVLDEFALPNPVVLVLAAISAVLVAAGGRFAAFERSPQRPQSARIAAMLTGVALPMAMFGAAMALWRYSTVGHGNVAAILGAVLVISILVAVTLSGRLFALIVAQACLWGALAITSGMPVIMGIYGLGCAMGVVLAVRQAKLDRAAQASQRETLRAQHRAEEILTEFEQTGQGWFWETDRKGLMTYVSPTTAAQLGKDQAQLLGQSLTDLFEVEQGKAEGERSLLFHLTARSSFADLPLRAASADERWWSVSGRPIYDGFNNFLGFRGSGSDLTEKRRSEQQATRLAHFDSLTGLANRFQMGQTLDTLLAAPRVDQRHCAVFLLDLDRFKAVNDTMGHPAGDALLKQVAQRLSHTVGDAGRVGRLGGDEFQVILPGRIAPERLAHLAHRIIENLSQPYAIEGARVVIGASVGIAMAPDHGLSSEDIIRNADLALYAAKDNGRGCYHFYAEDLHAEAKERRQLEQDLREALVTGGLELHYQPQVALGTQTISGFEALLRWNHPTQGRLSPAKFVAVAEEAGLITQIGEWALRTACHDMAQWGEDVRVAVNVSPLQFANPALPAIVTSALAEAGVASHRLELEITESVFLGDGDATDAMFASLKGIGVRLALDDFGTGYSSLGYLKKAPFDKIKIDQGFVRGATMAGSRNGAIIASIVSLANALDMETTAEGVETMDELDLVHRLGCSHVQGYIFAKPLTAADALELVGKGLSMTPSGPRSARAPRRTMLRKVTLLASGHPYPVTIRNISEGGAMFEGLLDVPVGLDVEIAFAEDMLVPARVTWSKEGRTGIQFARQIRFDPSGAILRGEWAYDPAVDAWAKAG
ncbi:EAL domain-containing protein [Novosphingobium umbonatum]|uniref:EAL domain-containing protein n=2 Tax=Novosphingobium umbonatum TaxID=1908524 RepID=A0A3S2VBY6_9SPHN|nr:EAL domain-containing protein [Novosphingobium umbonatum]